MSASTHHSLQHDADHLSESALSSLAQARQRISEADKQAFGHEHLGRIDDAFIQETESQKSSTQSFKTLRLVHQHEHDFPYANYLRTLEEACSQSARNDDELTPGILERLHRHDWKGDLESLPKDVVAGDHYEVLIELHHAMLYFSRINNHEYSQDNLELARRHDYFHSMFLSLWPASSEKRSSSEDNLHMHAARELLKSSIDPPGPFKKTNIWHASARWRAHLRHEFGTHENWLEWDWRFLHATYAHKVHVQQTVSQSHHDTDNKHSKHGKYPVEHFLHLGPAVAGNFRTVYIKSTLDHWSPPDHRHDIDRGRLLAYLSESHAHDLSYIKHPSVRTGTTGTMTRAIEAAEEFVRSGNTLSYDHKKAREVWHELMARIYDSHAPEKSRHIANELRRALGSNSIVWLLDDFRA